MCTARLPYLQGEKQSEAECFSRYFLQKDDEEVERVEKGTMGKRKNQERHRASAGVFIEHGVKYGL